MLSFIGILLTHWIADFYYQRREDAENKSHSNRALTNHVGTYGSILIFGATVFYNGTTYLPLYLVLILVNIVAHWGIDWITSRMSKRMFEQKRMHDFWVVIGFDQFLHVALLYVTLGIPY
jgi:hypothetical protein